MAKVVQYRLKLNPYGYAEQMGRPGGVGEYTACVSVMTVTYPEVTSESQIRALFPKQDHVFIYDAIDTLIYNMFIHRHVKESCIQLGCEGQSLFLYDINFPL